MKNIRYILFLFSILLVSCTNNKSLQYLKSNYVKVDDIEVHYKVFGNGENKIIFIHGWGCDINVWNKQMEYNFTNAQLVFIDLPGFGLSSKTKIEYSQNMFAKSVYSVLQKLKISNPIFVGHSLGYPVSRQVIKNYPNLKSKLCIVDGVYFKIPKNSIAKKAYMDQLEGFTNLFKGKQRDQNTSKFIKSLFIESTPQSVVDYTNFTMKNVEEHVGYSTMKHLIKEEVWSEIATNIPTLAIYANIPELPEDNEKYLNKLYPNLEYKEVNQTGHFIMMENPNEFNNLLNSFIEK